MGIFDDAWDQVPDSGGAAPSFDSAWDAVPEPTLTDNIISDIQGTPEALVNMVSSIPSGISNLATSGQALFSSLFTPQTISTAENLFSSGLPAPVALGAGMAEGASLDPLRESKDTLERTARGVGSLASAVAGAGMAGEMGLPPAVGMSVGDYAFNQLNQLTGSDAPTTGAEDAARLRKNIVQGGILSLAGKAGGNLITKEANTIRPEPPISPETQMINSLNPTEGMAVDYKAALPQGLARGVFTGDAAPTEIAARNEAAMNAIGDELHAPATPESPGGILAQADAAQADVNIPEFPRTENFIKENSVQEPALRKQLAERMDWLNKNWDGTISGLSRLKSHLYKVAYTGSTDSKILDQAIASDLKTAVEQQAEAAVPGLGSQVADLNGQLSDHYTLQDVIDKAVNRATKGEFKVAKPAPKPPGILKSAVRGALGGGGLSLLAGQEGFHGMTGPAMVTGALLEGGRAALKNPKIAGVVSNLADHLAFASKLAGKGISLGVPVANPIPQQKGSPPLLVAEAPPIPQPTPEVSVVPSPVSFAPAPVAQESIFSPIELDALRQVESGGGKSLLSSAGAQGPYQFMPDTAAAYNLKDPFNEALSRVAAKKLLEDEYKALGAKTLAYAAYNAGRPAVLRAIDKAHSNRFEDISPFLPVETQSYVPKIAAALQKLQTRGV